MKHTSKRADEVKKKKKNPDHLPNRMTALLQNFLLQSYEWTIHTEIDIDLTEAGTKQGCHFRWRGGKNRYTSSKVKFEHRIC